MRHETQCNIESCVSKFSNVYSLITHIKNKHMSVDSSLLSQSKEKSEVTKVQDLNNDTINISTDTFLMKSIQLQFFKTMTCTICYQIKSEIVKISRLTI